MIRQGLLPLLVFGVWQITIGMKRASVKAWSNSLRGHTGRSHQTRRALPISMTQNLFKQQGQQHYHGSPSFSCARSSLSRTTHSSVFGAYQTRLFATSNTEEDSVFENNATFESIGVRNPILLQRLSKLGLVHPTKVQAETYAKIASLENHKDDDDDDEDNDKSKSEFDQDWTTTRKPNVVIGSETGSGKTLAYLLPLLDDILNEKQEQYDGSRKMLSYDYARAIILVPNKELVQQVVRMAVPLCGGSKSVIWAGGATLPSDENQTEDEDLASPSHHQVRLAVLPGGLFEPMDFKPFRDSIALGGGTELPIDIIIATPAALGPLGLKPKHIDMFADIQSLVIDEADMLLDGGYIRPLENVLMGFRRADRLDSSMGVVPTQHIFCAATLPDFGLKSVDAYLQRKFPHAERVQMSGMHNARHYGLKQATQWIGPVETKKERMEQLLDMLKTPAAEGGLLGEKVMVFLNSVEDVEGAQGALERAGVASVPYHAKIKLDERSQSLDRFRRFESQSENDSDAVPVLVCTDLASRGLDVPGVSAVVQLQFSGNVVSHLHRMGRCGRAGQRTGRGIVYFNEAEQELVQVVQEAEQQQERMVLEGDVDDRLGNDNEDPGKVKKAFSRKRGFTKKRKKLQREGQA